MKKHSICEFCVSTTKQKHLKSKILTKKINNCFGYRVGVLLGDTIDGTDPDCENGFCAEPAQYIKVERIFVPSTYNKPYLAHDIALIKLAQPAQLNGK